MTRTTTAEVDAALPPHGPAAATTPPLEPRRNPRRRLASLRTIAALVLREMSTRYGRTPGGYVWALLEPLAAILFLSVGFSLVMRSPSLGNSFLLFYATGYLPFDIYRALSNTTGRALAYSKPLLKFPAVTWVDAILARFCLNSLTGILITILLLGGVLTVIDSRTLLDLPPAVLAMALSMVLGLGVGTLNCALIGLYPLWGVVWAIFTRPLFLASGVIYIFEDLPPMAQDILWFNPVIHVTGLMRTGFYPTYAAAYASPTYVLFVGLILLALGLVLMGRYHRDILNR